MSSMNTISAKITGVFLLLLLLCSCAKTLDVSPQDSLTFRNGLDDAKNFEAILRGAGQYLMTEARDESNSQALKGEYADYDQFASPSRQLSHQIIISGKWIQHYSVIAETNIVLNFVDQTSLPQERKDLYKGEAYFFKALAYFELIRQYGDCVLVPDVVTSDPQAKTPWPVVATYAIDLAEKAADLLPEFAQVRDADGTPATFKSTPARGPANALLAHLCAWKAGTKYFSVGADFDENVLWTRAEKAATAVIESGQYSLAANPEAVASDVLVGDSHESIYETVFKDHWSEMPDIFQGDQFISANQYQTWPAIPLSGPSSHGALRISNNTVKTMFPDGDLRRNAYFYMFDEYAKPTHIFETQGYSYPYKFRQTYLSTSGFNVGTFKNYNVNKVWWRLADIILLRAECRVRLGNSAGAVTDLNTIRSRANAAQYAPSEYNGDLRYAIFKEREKELLIESTRYYDVIRNGYANTELEGGFRTATFQDFKDGAFFLMISLQNLGIGEFDTNPLMRQNTYWLKYL
jgi:starch-binding outer membrane protein, SusD/RagB family